MDVDSFGNVFVADSYNHRIWMVTSAGVVSTVAGNGAYGSGVVTTYAGVTSSGNTNSSTPTTATTYTGSWGSNIDGLIPDAQVRRPWGITIGPDGAMYVTTEHRVRKIE